MKETKLSNVLAKAVKIAQTEERRLIVYRNEADVWVFDSYIPLFLQSPTMAQRTVIFINAYTGYETITTVENVTTILPFAITR